MVTQPQMPEEGESARIMSLQKSKGLTSRVVIAASCVEGIIPVFASDETPAEQDEILKEQRRLFYVALRKSDVDIEPKWDDRILGREPCHCVPRPIPKPQSGLSRYAELPPDKNLRLQVASEQIDSFLQDEKTCISFRLRGDRPLILDGLVRI
jgi:superfamily I DNA/RNA helicase